MTGPKDIVTAAKIIEAAASRIQPALAEKMVLTLPEIFGPGGKSAAQVFANAPKEGEMLGMVATKFQEKLAAFGLSSNATPAELFKAVKTSGLPGELTGGMRRNHYAGGTTFPLGDHEIAHSVGAGRSGRVETTLFRTRDGMAGISEKHSNFFGSKSDTIAFYTPKLRMESALARQLKALGS